MVHTITPTTEISQQVFCYSGGHPPHFPPQGTGSRGGPWPGLPGSLRHPAQRTPSSSSPQAQAGARPLKTGLRGAACGPQGEGREWTLPPLTVSEALGGPLRTCQCPWRAAQNRGGTPLLLVRDTAAPRSSSSSHTSSFPRPAAAVRAEASHREDSLLGCAGPKFFDTPAIERKGSTYQ